MPSSAATEPTSAGMPTPRFSTAPGLSSVAQRRAITLRSDSGMVCTPDSGTRSWPEYEGL